MVEAIRHDKQARPLRRLREALESGRFGPIRRLVNTLQPPEIAHLLESLPPGQREIVWSLVDPADDGEVLVHVGEGVRQSLLAAMDFDEIVAAVQDLEMNRLAGLAKDLPEGVMDQLLKSFAWEKRAQLTRILSSPENSAARLLNRDVVTVGADVSVNEVFGTLRAYRQLPEQTDHLFVINNRRQYLGRIALAVLVTQPQEIPINRLIDDDPITVHIHDDAREIARRFADHNWLSAPVINDQNILLGRITLDDILPMIRDQGEHQAMSAAGLDEEEDVFSPARLAYRRRLLWLGINLLTAFLASSVVSQFAGTIEQIVALATLMPIVAGMGGNAGTQVLALMVRGLALGHVGQMNVFTLLKKELSVALINGCCLGIGLGLVVLFWFHQPVLSLIIGAALTINLCTAALGGVLIPAMLKHLNFDPALAGGVILTTLTDVMGFFSFLGLAAWILAK